MWKNAVLELAAGMENLTQAEAVRMREQMINASAKLGYVPICNLKKAGGHRFGPRRAWPKWKTLRRVWGIMAKMKKEMQDIEDEILHLLASSQGNILDDETLINTLAASKVCWVLNNYTPSQHCFRILFLID